VVSRPPTPSPREPKVRSLPRILVVDDEEAILETMTFTFQDDYEVLTSSDARRALDLLDEKAPVAVVLSDQRMPNMSGVEFVTEVWKRHPSTVRMILTGFADMRAIIEAINDGHVYAYITKPWEPDHLKQVMKQAVEHYNLTVENERLVAGLSRANLFLEAVMDHLDTGALAVDASGVIQAVNRPARDYLALEGDLRGKPLEKVIEKHGLAEVGKAAFALAEDRERTWVDVEVRIAQRGHRLRITMHSLTDGGGVPFGRVILIREISHEPMQRRFDDLVGDIVACTDELRGRLEKARELLRAMVGEAQESRIDSPGMGELVERIARTRTAIENWLDVDEALAREDFPDAQLLQDRMRVAMTRWPMPDEVPARVKALAHRVEEYYESGENPKQRVL
jgi:FixJ family two-component response regulator